MTRPEIIRADSIDLQDQQSPSAKDHTRQPNSNVGAHAPHQAEALREVAAETADEQHRSPRVSKEWSTLEAQQVHNYRDDELAAGVTASLTGANLQRQDDLAIAQNGGLTGSATEDAEMADAEGDDGMEDDMMDKISSSPSIDDGGYSLPGAWPTTCGLPTDSVSCARAPLDSSSPSFTQACGESSSPFVETPDHYPLKPLKELLDIVVDQEDQATMHHNHHNHHHQLLQGEYRDKLVHRTQVYGSHDNKNQDIQALHDFSSCHADALEPFMESYDIDYDLDLIPHDLFTAPSQPPVEEHYELEEEDSLIIPYEESSEEDDDYDDISYDADSRFVDSGWGGECLQDSEDIDFEFVYALHTFVATVEGQANATKGDTMVLLDDSNSYWWLVRVVKDSSIGYLPAEHIETPTERLARRNKHRNIDLTSAMLGDQAEKTKNPLKKAIRRRNAKTVTFAAPTYVEASDVDYSTDEEDGEGEYYGEQEQQQQAEAQQQNPEEDEIVAVEPLKPRAELREVKSESLERVEPAAKLSSETARTSDELFDGKLEIKSRNGTVRNTDSFFKDDSVETRKITITPNLLRDDDSSASTRTSNDSKELKQRPSLDKLEKDSITDKNRDKKDKKDKKEKDKKPGMLSGLFKRKDKKAKSPEDDIDEASLGKRSNENARSSPVPSKDSEELMTIEEQSQTPSPEVQRQPSKLQKQTQTEISPSRKPSSAKDRSVEPVQTSSDRAMAAAESVQAPSLRMVQPESQANSEQPSKQSRHPPEVKQTPAVTAPKEKSAGTISKILRSENSSGLDPKPVKTKKAKSRVELDDFDSSEENSPVEEPTQSSKQPQRPIPGSFPDSYISTTTAEKTSTNERLSESPVQISPITPSQSYPPALMIDTSSQEEPTSPVSSPSPELIDAEDAKKGSSMTSTTSTSTQTWSDSHLRTFFDDDADIRDLLVVVYDKSGVVPAGPDHPITGNLFKEEHAKLADITNRLDGMLGDWLARKMRTQATR